MRKHKRNKIVEWQKLDEVNRKPCAGSSSYWEWVEAHSQDGKSEEMPIANPDVLPEQGDSIETEETRELIADLFKILSDRERDIADLLTEGKSEYQIAKLLSISKGSVQRYKDRIRNKLESLSSKRDEIGG